MIKWYDYILARFKYKLHNLEKAEDYTQELFVLYLSQHKKHSTTTFISRTFVHRLIAHVYEYFGRMNRAIKRQGITLSLGDFAFKIEENIIEYIYTKQLWNIVLGLENKKLSRAIWDTLNHQRHKSGGELPEKTRQMIKYNTNMLQSMV